MRWEITLDYPDGPIKIRGILIKEKGKQESLKKKKAMIMEIEAGLMYFEYEKGATGNESKFPGDSRKGEKMD